MEEIKVGEYVRTYNGLIGKIVQITDSGNYAIRIYNGAEYVVRAVIVKHSKNIIDLIEVGDIVELDGEKYQVIYDKSYNKLGILIPNKDYLAIRHTSLEYIFQKNKKVTILTHEQYENNCYRIGE